jgi:hypothetical protein
MKTPAPTLLTGGETRIEAAWRELRASIAAHPRVTVKDAYANAACYVFRLADTKLIAICEVEEHDDGQLWAHLSVSAAAPRRLPTWRELRWAKEHFLGDRRAIMVLPPKAEYVNITWNVLNLYACLTAQPLPDFRYKDPFTDEVGI